MKLHLGCGRKKLPGWINCDLANNAYGVRPDVAADLRALPFDADTARTIMAIHVWEHFYLHEIDDIIEEWKRVMVPGGRLILEMPCLDKVARFLSTGKVHPALTLWALYGDPSTIQSEADLHKWCWSMGQIENFLAYHGFHQIEFKEPRYHRPERDMRIEAVK